MINLIFAAIVASSAVYRLELQDETPYIVGGDGIRRQVCIVDPAEYAMMTGKVDQVWRSLNSSEDGRKSLHGARVRTEVDTNLAVRVTVYQDGYRHSVPMEIKRPDVHKKMKVNDTRISNRQMKFREALMARRNAKPKEVTVEHDAANGKDEVK